MKKTIVEQATEYAQSHSDVRQAYIDGYNAALKARSQKAELDLSFVHPIFADVMEKWLTYKKERKQTYTQSGVESCYKKLVKLSNGDPRLADAIVEQSMASNWAGLFELKNNGLAQFNRSYPANSQSPGSRRESVSGLANLAGGVLRAIAGNNPQGDSSL